MNIIKVNKVHVAAAKGLLTAKRVLNEKIENEDEVIKLANAKRKPDPSLPEQETQYILED